MRRVKPDPRDKSDDAGIAHLLRPFTPLPRDHVRHEVFPFRSITHQVRDASDCRKKVSGAETIHLVVI